MEKLELVKINATIEGLSDIMFDKFIDHSKEVRPPEQKLYLFGDNQLIFPADNIISFLFGEQNPSGCAKQFEGKRGKDYIRTGQSHINIDPLNIPFTDDKNKKIKFSGFNKGQFWIHEGSPRTKGAGSGSIKHEMKCRPVLSLPWELSFQITLVKNVLIDETKLYNWFVQGGILISIGTYRPRFGRFNVKAWDIENDNKIKTRNKIS